MWSTSKCNDEKRYDRNSCRGFFSHFRDYKKYTHYCCSHNLNILIIECIILFLNKHMRLQDTFIMLLNVKLKKNLLNSSKIVL